jgi:hypothetical protein
MVPLGLSSGTVNSGAELMIITLLVAALPPQESGLMGPAKECVVISTLDAVRKN